jgi:ABC-type uncharacterized transport system substrate-binding protein
MRRRDFIEVVAGSTVASPLPARAQQPTMPVIGFLHLTSLETNRGNLATFRQGLGETGYIENKNVTIEYRWAQGRNDQLATLVAELVRQQVSVIAVLETTNGALAAKAATQTIPVVFLQAADPVRIGLVKSLNRPGGNVTGIALMGAETAAKRLELLLELVPKATSIGYLRNPANPVYAESETKEVEIAARAHGVRLVIVNANRLTAMVATPLLIVGSLVQAEPVKFEALVAQKEAIRLDFADASKHFLLLVRREGKSQGQGPLANAAVQEYGAHDIVPGVGGEPRGKCSITRCRCEAARF